MTFKTLDTGRLLVRRSQPAPGPTTRSSRSSAATSSPTAANIVLAFGLPESVREKRHAGHAPSGMASSRPARLPGAVCDRRPTPWCTNCSLKRSSRARPGPRAPTSSPASTSIILDELGYVPFRVKVERRPAIHASSAERYERRSLVMVTSESAVFSPLGPEVFLDADGRRRGQSTASCTTPPCSSSTVPSDRADRLKPHVATTQPGFRGRSHRR